MTQNGVNIFSQKFEKNYNFEDEEILKLNINNFEVFTKQNPNVLRRINGIIDCQSCNFLAYSYNILFADALEEYKNSNPETLPFRPYEAFMAYTLTYNQNCYLSYYVDKYIFTGGAHGNTNRMSCTFSLETGEPVMVYRFFKNLNYKSYIISEITRQATLIENENPGTLFENYRELIKENFKINNYYLTPEGIVFYFQQYEIAPYSSGILTFTIPYSEVNSPPSCRKRNF